MRLSIGTYLNNGKYRIEKVLGQGSFGITVMSNFASVISEKLNQQKW